MLVCSLASFVAGPFVDWMEVLFCFFGIDLLSYFVCFLVKCGILLCMYGKPTLASQIAVDDRSAGGSPKLEISPLHVMKAPLPSKILLLKREELKEFERGRVNPAATALTAVILTVLGYASTPAAVSDRPGPDRTETLVGCRSACLYLRGTCDAPALAIISYLTPLGKKLL
jgi:hypothetical protein